MSKEPDELKEENARLKADVEKMSKAREEAEEIVKKATNAPSQTQEECERAYEGFIVIVQEALEYRDAEIASLKGKIEKYESLESTATNLCDLVSRSSEKMRQGTIPERFWLMMTNLLMKLDGLNTNDNTDSPIITNEVGE